MNSNHTIEPRERTLSDDRYELIDKYFASQAVTFDASDIGFRNADGDEIDWEEIIDAVPQINLDEIIAYRERRYGTHAQGYPGAATHSGP